MEAKRVKQDDLEDSISELPDGIVSHILSLLPTVEAVRTSVLSRRWRHMWTLVSAVDISDSRDTNCFTRRDRNTTGRKKVLKFVDECLKYPYGNTTVSKFKLQMKFRGGGGRIDEWLQSPALQKVKELELRLGVRDTYTLPRPVLYFKGLTLLDLKGDLALDIPFPVSLPSLKALRLTGVAIDDQKLNNVLSGSPSLEELLLVYCGGLLDPQVTGSSLKSMEFRNCWDSRCRSIKVEAANLQSFVYFGWHCKVNLVRCRAIRKILLRRASLAEPWLVDLVPQLPLLESLVLDRCYGLQRIKISNQHLKRFSFGLDERSDSKEITIVGPSLVSFQYAGYSMIKISVDAPNLVDARIIIFDYPRKTCDEEWYVSLANFLTELKGCKKVGIFCSSEKARIIPDLLRKVRASIDSESQALEENKYIID